MSNVPKLRFKEFSDEWEEKKYGNIYSFYSTNSLSRDNLNYKSGSVKNIHYGDIHTKFNTMFDIQNENVPFVNTDIDLSKIKEESYCLNGDLVIADASEDYDDIGKTIEIINLNNEKVIAGLHTFLARPNKYDMALGFTGYLLQSWKVRKQVMTIAQGTKVLSLSTGRLSKVKLDLPSKQEQEKIASFLNQVDTKIEQLTKKEKLLEQYKKGIMQKIFSQEIRFKDDSGSKFPKWEDRKLEDVTIKISDGIHSTPKYDENGSYYFINGNNLNNGEIEINKKTKRVVETEYLKHKRDLNENTILLSINGTIGNIAFYKDEKVVLGKSACYININKEITNKKYISYILNTSNIQNFFSSELTGSTIKNLSLKTIKNTKVPFPCLEEQNKIANFLSSIDKKIEQNQKTLKQTKTFKKALLQQMFV